MRIANKIQTDISIDWEEQGLLPEANWAMSKEMIIFFDKLGFGWVLDDNTAKELELSHLKYEHTVNISLIKIIEELLDYTGV